MTDNTDTKPKKAASTDAPPTAKETRRICTMITDGISPSSNVLLEYSGITEDMHLLDYAKVLKQRADKVHDNDLSHLEGMLASQAAALDAIFMHHAVLAKHNLSKHLDASNKFLTIAMKAQNQCRMTIGTLAEVKNPKPYIQHNNATNQQVNNGTTHHAAQQPDQYCGRARARTEQKSPVANNTNELLTHQPADNVTMIEDEAYETMDRRRT